MKQILMLLFMFLNLSSAITAIYSQAVDEIIKSYADALGGADKLLSITSLKYTGTTSGSGADIPMTITVNRSGKTRTELNYQGMKLIRACDDNTGWVIDPFSGTRDAELLPSEQVKELRKYSEIEGELINYNEKGYKAEFLEKDDFEGSEVYKIKLTNKDGDVTYYFIDIGTSLLLMDKRKRKVGEKEVTTSTVYGNYQRTDGILFPMSFEVRQSNSGSEQKLDFQKVEINVQVDESIFKVPGSN